MRNLGPLFLAVFVLSLSGCTGGESVAAGSSTKAKGNSAWVRWANLTEKPVTVILDDNRGIGPIAPNSGTTFFKGRAKPMQVKVQGDQKSTTLNVAPEGDDVVTFFVRITNGKYEIVPLTKETRRADDGKTAVRFVNLTKAPLTIGADTLAPGAASEGKEYSVGNQTLMVTQGNLSVESKINLGARDSYTVAVYADKAGKLIAVPVVGAAGFGLQSESRTTSPG